MAEPNVLVISFVTRGLPSSPFGQGEEILFFRPRRGDDREFKSDGAWTFLTLECLFAPNPLYPSLMTPPPSKSPNGTLSETEEPPTPLTLAHKSLMSSLHLSATEDSLRLVRQGRRIQWDEQTVIEAFLWRMSEDYEKGMVESARRGERVRDHGIAGVGGDGNTPMMGSRMSGSAWSTPKPGMMGGGSGGGGRPGSSSGSMYGGGGMMGGGTRGKGVEKARSDIGSEDEGLGLDPPPIPATPATNIDDVPDELKIFEHIETVVLSSATHYWASLDGFYLEGAIESDLVSTALHSVCMPSQIENSLEDLYFDHQSGSQQIATKALDALYTSVSSKTAHNAFRFWPEGVDQRPGGEVPWGVIKMRLFAYWVDVTAYHLRHVRPTMEASISYALLRALEPMMHAIGNDEVNVDDFEKGMAKSIATEAERSRIADKLLVRQAVVEVLWKPQGMSQEESKGKLHVVTISASSAVCQVLTKIIQRVLTPHPDSPTEDPLDPGAAGAFSRLRQPQHLHITIGESRPLNEGVALAQRLYAVIEKAHAYNKKHYERQRKQTHNDLGMSPRSFHAGGGGGGSEYGGMMSPAFSLNQRMRQAMSLSGGDRGGPGGGGGPGSSGGYSLNSSTMRRQNMNSLPPALADLLAAEAKPEKPPAKVTIEIVTDGGIGAVIQSSSSEGNNPIILIGADRILPNGDVINKTGSLFTAWSGRQSSSRVFVVSRGDKVQSANAGDAFTSEENDGNELSPAWYGSAGGSQAAEKLKSFVTKAIEDETLKITNSYFERVPSEYISSYITELGPLNIHQIQKLGQERADLEDKVWGKD